MAETTDEKVGSGVALGRDRLLLLPRYWKRLILVGSDLVLLYAVLVAVVALRFGNVEAPRGLAQVVLFAAGPILTVATFAWFGLYRLVTRFIGPRGTSQVIACMALSVLIWALIVFMAGQQGVPRSVILFYGLVGCALVIASRQAAGWLLNRSGLRLAPDRRSVPVLIYGAGASGVRLAEALRHGGEREVLAYVDSQPTLWGQYVGGYKVYRPDRLGVLIARDHVREVLLALDGPMRKERRAILDALEPFPVQVKVMPAMEDIAEGRVRVTDLRPVDVVDLLGRDPVPPNPELMSLSTRGKSILVTGAGGSIGSELVRQIARLGPRRIVLFDMSEPALYLIDREMAEAQINPPPGLARPEFVTVLGSVLDTALVRDTIRAYEIQTVYHAAAYKHVPMVEHNPISGLMNNAFGTAVVADEAIAAGVERFVLISTDKAVRPTNVMGATKRLAELILQSRAAAGTRTVCTMVRFGNVLDSSGSVVQRFRKQIEAGGPVTVTHPEIIRYFMSIPEASQLVIQAGAMGKGGEVYVLDMGEPVKIIELARMMIHLSGFEVRGPDAPNGDIAIEFTGLRPGEKLFEELLIDSTAQPTQHPRIFRAAEPHLAAEALTRQLDTLAAAARAGDVETIQAVLETTVEGYRPDAEGVGRVASRRASWGQSQRTLH